MPFTARQGIVDWSAAMEILRSWGYRGYLSLEDFRPASPIDKAREALSFFKRHGVA